MFHSNLSSNFDKTVEISKILQIILDAAFSAYRPAAAVAWIDVYRLVYPYERSEFLSPAAGTAGKQLRYIEQCQYCQKGRK